MVAGYGSIPSIPSRVGGLVQTDHLIFRSVEIVIRPGREGVDGSVLVDIVRLEW